MFSYSAPLEEHSAAGRARGLRLKGAGKIGMSSTIENVTVLFTDRVGSTALASMLAADAAESGQVAALQELN